MKKESGINKFGKSRAFVVFWLGLLCIGYFPNSSSLGLLFLLILVYVIFMDRINERVEHQAQMKKAKANDEPQYKPEEHGELFKCPYCGKAIPSDIKYCYYCGKSLEAYRNIEAIRIDSTGRMTKAAEAIGENDKKEGILDIRDLTDKILRKYAEKPDQKSDYKKFTEYYLPKTLSAIEHYQILCSLDNLDPGEIKVKKQLEDSIDMIREAFSNIFNRVSTEGLYDLSADVSVLEKIIQQDGLADSDFETE